PVGTRLVEARLHGVDRPLSQRDHPTCEPDPSDQFWLGARPLRSRVLPARGAKCGAVRESPASPAGKGTPRFRSHDGTCARGSTPWRWTPRKSPGGDALAGAQARGSPLVGSDASVRAVPAQPAQASKAPAWLRLGAAAAAIAGKALHRGR